MNQYLKVAIGAAAGATIGWFIGSVIVEYIHLVEDDDTYSETEEMPQGNEADPEESEGPNLMTKTKPGKRDYASNFDPMMKASLESLARRYRTGDEPTESEENKTTKDLIIEQEADETPTPQTGPIQIISLADYANSDSGYEQLTLTYYDDDVLTDENDEPIPGNLDKVVGTDALVSFGILSQDEDVVYVRNTKLRAEYEIVRANKNYAAPDPQDRRKRKEFDDEDRT